MGFLKAFVTNVQRGKRLQPWVAVLGKPLLDGTPLSGLSEKIADQNAALESLLNFCISDAQTGPIVRAYGATRADLQAMYGEILFCAGVWRGSNYVPAAVFGFPKPLEHFLANRNKISDVDLANQLVTMFETHTYL